MKKIIPILFLSVALVLPACREQSKEEIYQQGMTFVDAGNYQAAVTLFKDALDKDPNYIDARLQLGIAYQETEKADKAEKELEKVLRQAPDNSEVSIRLATIYLQTKRPDKAIQQLDRLYSSNPDNSEALRILAESHAAKGDLQTAEKLFRKSLLTKPNFYEAQLGLARLLYMTDRTAEGDRLVGEVIDREPDYINAYYLLLRKALGQRDLNGAIEYLEKINAIKPEDIFSSYMLGMLYLDVDRADDARRIANDLKKRNPNHPAGFRIEGVVLYLNGKYEPAIETLQKSLNGMPDLPGFYFLGLANYRFNHLEQALSSFQKALDKSPNHEPSRLMVAQTLLKQGHTEDCIQQAKLVIENNAQNAEAHNLLGSAYLIQKQYDLAMEHIETAIQINPNLAQAHLKKGLFNIATGKTKEGEGDLFNAVNAAPEVMNTRLLLATYYLRQNNFPMAQKILEEGLTVSPDSALIHNLIAAAKFGQNKPEEAIQSLEKAKRLKPDYFSPYLNIANYHISRKDYQAALQEYQSLLLINPNYVPALLRSATLHELLGQNDMAESYYKKAVDAQTPTGYLTLSAFYKRSGNQDAAQQTLKTGYEAIPDDPSIHIAYGEMLESQGQFDDAIKVYVHLEEIRPGMGKPRLLISHVRKGDFDAAREIAEREVAADPSSAQGYLFQSVIHEYSSEWELAEKTMRKGLAATENNLILWTNLARLQNIQGAQNEALKTYDDILAENPEHIPAIFPKATILDVKGDKKQAQALYEKILAIDKNHVPTLNNLAYLLMDVYSDNERALQLATQGFQLESNDPRIVDTLGYALLKNGQIENSIIFLEKASSALPGEVTIKIHLAQAYKAAGRNEDAVASLTAINTTKAHKSQLQEVKALLKELN